MFASAKDGKAIAMETMKGYTAFFSDMDDRCVFFDVNCYV